MNIEDKIIKLEISIQSLKEQSKNTNSKLLELQREIDGEILKTRQESWGYFKFLVGSIFGSFLLYQILAHW